MINDPKNSLPVLPQIKINSPCPMDWDEMDGDASRRFCGHCQKHVHNFAEMDADSVGELLGSGISICAKIKKRADGSIVTKERRISRRTWFGRLGALAASVAAFVTLGGCREPVDEVMGGMEAPAPVAGPMLMGEVESVELGDVMIMEPPAAALEPEIKQEIMGKVAPHTATPE